MAAQDLIRLILKNAGRNKRRTVLMVLSIAISLFLLTTLLTVWTNLNRGGTGTADSALRLVTRNAVSLGQTLPIFYVEQIRRIPGVKNAIPMQWFGGIYIDREHSNFAQFAADPEQVFDVFSEFKTAPESLEAFKKERTACVVGKKLMDRFNWKLGQRITLQGTFFPVNLELTIRGVFTSEEEDWENLVIFNYTYLNESLPSERKDSVNSIRLKVTSAEAIPRVIEAIDGMFQNSLAQTKSETEKAFFLSFASMWGNVKLLVFGVCGVVMFSILMVVANTMAMTIRERTMEIAVLKTLGFTSRLVLALLVAESIFVALLGWVLGAGGAWAVWTNLDLRRAGIQLFFGHLRVLPSTLVLGLVVALLLGILSSSLPALRASQLRIAQGFRQV